MPSQKIWNAEGKTCLAGLLVDADHRQRKADEKRCQPAKRRIAESGRNGHEGEYHQSEIFTRPEDQRQFDDVGRDEGKAERGYEAGDERTDRRCRQRRTAATRARHLVTLERSHDRGAFTRRIEQDGGGRAAIHAAVVDTGKHDQRTGRVELVGDGEKKGNGQRRADARQNADRGAKSDTDERVKKVHRLHGDQDALEEEFEGAHRIQS